MERKTITVESMRTDPDGAIAAARQPGGCEVVDETGARRFRLWIPSEPIEDADELKERLAEVTAARDRLEKDMSQTLDEMDTLAAERVAVCEVLNEAMVPVPFARERGDIAELAYRVSLLRARCVSLEVDRDSLRSQLAEARAALREACDGWEARIMVNPRVSREGYMKFEHSAPALTRIAELRKVGGDE